MRQSWDRSICKVFAAAAYKKQWVCERTGQKSAHARDGLADHKDYHAAKYERDIDAALRVVRDTMDRLYIAKLKITLNELSEKGIKDPILVAPFKEHGTNMLARAAAVYLGRELGLEVDTDIVQTNRENRKEMTQLEKVFSPATFEGQSKKNRVYIIVEDNVTTGGTVADLRSHLINNGSRFAFACAISTPTGQNVTLKPSDSDISTLTSTLSSGIKGWIKNVAHISLDSLTGFEVGVLQKSAKRGDIGRLASETI